MDNSIAQSQIIEEFCSPLLLELKPFAALLLESHTLLCHDRVKAIVGCISEAWKISKIFIINLFWFVASDFRCSIIRKSHSTFERLPHGHIGSIRAQSCAGWRRSIAVSGWRCNEKPAILTFAVPAFLGKGRYQPICHIFKLFLLTAAMAKLKCCLRYSSHIVSKISGSPPSIWKGPKQLAPPHESTHLKELPP